MTRLWFWLLAALLLNGCAARGLFENRMADDERLFLQGLQVFPGEGERPADFERLSEAYPESPWNAKVRELEILAEQSAERGRKILQLEREVAALQNRQRRQQQQIEELKKELTGLETERQKLRQLLIDMEQRTY